MEYVAKKPYCAALDKWVNLSEPASPFNNEIRQNVPYYLLQWYEYVRVVT